MYKQRSYKFSGDIHQSFTSTSVASGRSFFSANQILKSEKSGSQMITNVKAQKQQKSVRRTKRIRVFFSVFQHHLKTTTNTCQRVQEM
jgi:hypothetical protein